MSLNKQPVSINFTQGLNTKSDPYQVPVGQFLNLVNSVFTTEGRLTKRNGFPNLTALPNAVQTTLTTLNDNLIATGSSLYSFNDNTDIWTNKGVIQPVHLNVQSLVRSGTGQSSPDMAISPKGLVCMAYNDTNGNSYYQLSDINTGEQIVSRQLLPNAGTTPRVFLLGQYFIVMFLSTITAAVHLQYIAIPIDMPDSPIAVANIASNVKSLTGGFDGYVANNALYLAYATAASSIIVRSLSSTLGLTTGVTLAGATASLMSVTADVSGATPIVWVSYYDSGNAYTAAFNQILATVLAPTQFLSSVTINQLTSTATDMVLSLFYENQNTYGIATISSVKTDYISTKTVTQAGVVSSASVLLRSVGLASKPVTFNDQTYMLVTYGETNQPTYFLMDTLGNVYMRLAYSNGGGYESTQILPSVSVYNDSCIVPYLIKDFLTSINKGTDLATGVPVNAIYTQTGISAAEMQINTSGQFSSEIASALHLTGGQLWEYDSTKPVEHGFQVWPENIGYATATTTGFLTSQKYFYAFTYEWTDNQGNLHRSAPSIPLLIDLTGAGTSTNKNTLYVPTLRITYKKSPNPVKIVGYRWSTAQQVYYQFTSVSSPTLNDTTVDYVTIVDTLADTSILGNAILYTTGGVLENIAAPASSHSTLFDNRLWLIDAEDPNLLWYSKQVIETTPVEMSDLLTRYIAPTAGAQGSTGPSKCLAPMDDKLIIFKPNAAYYINGTGPDNTGANSNYSDNIFITSAVGCSNPASIVLMPSGLMFQSNKGIWLLGRDLSTSYIGADVEEFNNNSVVSANAIPGTTQVRFVLDNNTILMYDYYFKKWATFTSVYAISSAIYQSKDTYLNSFGSIFQESAGTYLDGSAPVLMSFTTSWISMAGLQGFERMYFGYLLGTYYTPFKLSLSLAYDYNSSSTQTITITPDNFAQPWGGEALWGSGQAWGGPGNVFESRFFPSKQKCETFQVTIQELYDASLGQAAGAGLTLSGMNLIIGTKRGYRTQSAKRSFG